MGPEAEAADGSNPIINHGSFVGQGLLLRNQKVARILFSLIYSTLSRTELMRCDVVILGQFLTAFFVIIILQVKVRIFISNDVAIV